MKLGKSIALATANLVLLNSGYAAAELTEVEYLQKRGLISDAAEAALKVIIPPLLGLENVVNTVGSTLECGACQAALVLASGVIDLTGEHFFLGVVEDICSAIEPADVCTGIVPSLGPYLVSTLQGSNSLVGYTGQLICNSFLQTCPNFTPKSKTFNYLSPSTSAVDNFDSSGVINSSSDATDEYLTVMHVSDIHYDPQYLPGSEANCKYPMCCEARTQSSSTVKEPASEWGEFLCDLPYKFIDNWGSNIKATVGQDPDFSLFTGDVPPHNVWYDNETTVTDAFDIYNVLIKYVKNPLYATFGNHDTSPVNMLYPTDLEGFTSASSNQWAFEALGNYFSNWLPNETISHFQSTYGTYAIRPRKGLKIINLNTVDCYIDNFYVFYDNGNDVDPNGQLQWLVNELADSQQKGEAVWLMGHVAPADSDCIVPWSNLFNGIVNHYADIIKGQFYGHSHKDQFAVHYDDNGHASNVQYLAPSLTTFTELNAGYRVYKIHPTTFEVMDSITYIANMSEVNTWAQPTWVKEYSAREYDPSWPTDAPLNATFWGNIINKFKNDDALFTKYSTFLSKTSSASPPCNPSASCRTEIIAGLEAGNSKNKYYPQLFPSFGSTNKTIIQMARAASVAKNSTTYSYRKRACMH